MIVRTRPRRMLAGVATALLASLSLVGCAGALGGAGMNPWVVANHDAKVQFHEGAGQELLNLDITGGLAALPEFQATGYLHFALGDSATHLEYRTSIIDESFVSQLYSDIDGISFDQSHEGGSGVTYYLLGTAYKDALADGKSWVIAPQADLDRQQNPENVCALFAVSYSCALIDAWNLTNAELESVPVSLSKSENGSQHFATAVTYRSLEDAGLVLPASSLPGLDAEYVSNQLVPMHLWVNPDGIVTKVEVNAVIEGEGDPLSVQIGFEITSMAASDELVPVQPEDVPAADSFRITTTDELYEFLEKLATLEAS